MTQLLPDTYLIGASPVSGAGNRALAIVPAAAFQAAGPIQLAPVYAHQARGAGADDTIGPYAVLNRVNVWMGIAALAAVCIFVGAAPRNLQQELWRHRNLGKALFENPATVAQAPAELKKALDLAPGSFRERLNYGLGLLRAGELEKAVVELRKAQAQDPLKPHTWFNLGIAYKRLGRHADAIRQFERMIRLVPDEPMAHHNLGLLYGFTDRGADALKQFQIAADLDPRIVASRLQIYNHYRLGDDEAAAERALADFRRVKAEQQAADDSEDIEWCYYAELYDPGVARPAGRDISQPVALKFDDRRLAGSVDPKTAHLTVVDSSAGGVSDLLVWSRDAVLLFSRGLEPAPGSGLDGLKDAVTIAPGDFDNDGRVDLCVITGNGVRLYRNMGGRFARVTDLSEGRFNAAVWLDFDHDYDLDLILLGPQSILLRNEGANGFRDYSAHFPFVPGEAVSAAALRSVPDTKGYDLLISYAGRTGVLYRDGLRGSYRPTPVEAVPPNASNIKAIDLDNDGWIDLVFEAGESVAFAANRNGRFERQTGAGPRPYAAADLENRGFTDLVLGNAVRRSQGRLQFAAARPSTGLAGPVAWTEADFDADGRMDLAGVAAGGSIHVLLNRTPTSNRWLRVSLEGVKNGKAGAGTEIEIKAGDLYRKQIYDGVPLLFGLAGHGQADTVRITWSNGLIQNEMKQAAGRAARFKEAPRLAGSCPMVFAWNGRGFEFITDVLGTAPLGASSGDGYFPVANREYVRIPEDALVAVDGRYLLRITEELHEVAYLDQVRLVAVDHPAETRIFTNDKFKAPPFPEFRLFGVRDPLRPIAAKDDRGRDVLSRILRSDKVYAAGFQHGAGGVADLHALEVDFGRNSAPANDAVLFLNGWVDWADGSTFYAASQSGKDGLVFPYLQVRDASGAWRTVIEDMGIPAGKPKTIAVDLTGKFLSASREIRIVTNLCLYWDEIFLGDHATPTAKLTPIDAGVANLRLRGFSRPSIDPRRERPEIFDYAAWTPAASWNQVPGLYTRYGDVRELLQSVDDRMGIMGSGDELELEFDSRSLAPVPVGWRRDFLLMVDGWAKDADANTAFSQSVEPLPFHGMSSYPYPPAEKYPDDAAHTLYRKQYNTRPAAGFVRPLAPRWGCQSWQQPPFQAAWRGFCSSAR